MLAAKRFAQHSAVFAALVIPAVADVVECMDTPDTVKACMIDIFRHTGHDAQTARRTQITCERLLSLLPGTAFTRQLLDILTLLATRTMLWVPDQVDTLLAFASRDLRLPIKVHALQALTSLAREVPHLWLQRHVDQLLAISEALELEAQHAAIAALGILLQSPYFPEAANVLLSGVGDILQHHRRDLVSAAQYNETCARCLIALHSSSSDEFQQLAPTLTSMSLTLISLAKEHSSQQHAVTVALRALGIIAKHSQACTAAGLDDVLSLISQMSASGSDNADSLITELIAFVQSVAYVQLASDENIDQISQAIQQLDGCDRPSHALSLTNALIAFIQQLPPQRRPEMVHTVLEPLLTSCKCFSDSRFVWSVYDVMRRATMVGLFSAAHLLLNRFHAHVHTRRSQHWMRALDTLAQAEASLSSIAVCVGEGLDGLQQSLLHFDAGIGTAVHFSFQSSYVQLRTGLHHSS